MAAWNLQTIAKKMWFAIRDWDYFQTNEVGQHLAKAAAALLQLPPPADPTATKNPDVATGAPTPPPNVPSPSNDPCSAPRYQ
ncbi:MAG: hypothetical protein AAGG51_23525 [Cyanobacteria bacterium P01_G01_bin.54]